MLLIIVYVCFESHIDFCTFCWRVFGPGSSVETVARQLTNLEPRKHLQKVYTSRFASPNRRQGHWYRESIVYELKTTKAVRSASGFFVTCDDCSLR